MMSMTFEASSSVTLLFNFWDVHGPAEMFLSVVVVFLLTVFYEVLKVWRVWLSQRGKLTPLRSPFAAPPPSFRSASTAGLDSSTSESSLTPVEPKRPIVTKRDSWILHGVQTLLHMLQVVLGYMLMLCVMSYNVWIFLGVVGGSVLGYFISFPLLGKT